MWTRANAFFSSLLLFILCPKKNWLNALQEKWWWWWIERKEKIREQTNTQKKAQSFIRIKKVCVWTSSFLQFTDAMFPFNYVCRTELQWWIQHGMCAMNSANFGQNRNVNLKEKKKKKKRKENVGNSFFLTIISDESEVSRRRSSEWLLDPN